MLIRQTVLQVLDDAPLQELAAIDPNLILIFADPAFFAAPDNAARLAAAFPGARCAGCSTAGEISTQGVTDHRIVLTAVRFERARFRIASTRIAGMADSGAAGRRLAEPLAGPELKAVILLSQGVAVNGSELIAGATAVFGPGVPITGGLAGDSGAFAQTWALLDDTVASDLMLAIGLYGDIGIAHGSFGGWQSFGPARRVTRAEGNVLFELDGEPALHIYKRYLGEYAAGLPATGLLFPFAILSDDREEIGLIRTMLGIDEAAGSLTLAGDIPQDGFLRLMHASSDALVDGAQAAAEAASRMYRSDAPALALLVSCIGRKLVMGDRVDEEVEAVGAVFGQNCVLTGFYSYGEISPFLASPDCKLHNQTMTITYLSEGAAG